RSSIASRSGVSRRTRTERRQRASAKIESERRGQCSANGEGHRVARACTICTPTSRKRCTEQRSRQRRHTRKALHVRGTRRAWVTRVKAQPMRIVSIEAITRLHKQARGLRRAARSLHSQARENADPSWSLSADRLDALVREHVGLLEAVLD